MIDNNQISSMPLEQYKQIVDQTTLNDLEKFFLFGRHRLMDKWLHYFEIYDRYFSKYRNKEVVIVEIGVFRGGSLQMWKNYFGDKCRIIGIDIDPTCKQYEEPQIEIILGSQSDRNFLRQLKERIPKIDILIDDGGHHMDQQKITFEELFDHISDDGVYLCEDLHTSYWSEYSGGYKNPNSYIEFSKNFVDYLNAVYSKSPDLTVNKFTQTANSIHYHDSVIVIEKKIRQLTRGFQITNQ